MRDRYYGTTIDRLRGGTEAYTRFGEKVSPLPPPDLPPEEEPSIWEKIFQPFSPKVQAWQQRQMPIAAVSDVMTAPEQKRGVEATTEQWRGLVGSDLTQKPPVVMRPRYEATPTKVIPSEEYPKTEKSALEEFLHPTPGRVGQTPGEKFVGEWIIPAIALQVLPTATVAWKALAPWVAAGGAKKLVAIGGRVLLSPLYGAEKAIELPIKAGSEAFKRLISKGVQTKTAEIMPEAAKAGEAVPKAGIPVTPEVTSQFDLSQAARKADIQGIRQEGTLAGYNLQSQQEWLGKGTRYAVPVPKDGNLTIYRATPTGGVISAGDYVTTSRLYAEEHIRNNLGGKGKITSIQGTLDDLAPADAPNEFWYVPKLAIPKAVPKAEVRAILAVESIIADVVKNYSPEAQTILQNYSKGAIGIASNIQGVIDDLMKLGLTRQEAKTAQVTVMRAVEKYAQATASAETLRAAGWIQNPKTLIWTHPDTSLIIDQAKLKAELTTTKGGLPKAEVKPTTPIPEAKPTTPKLPETKVVDATGQPKLVFHGTQGEIGSFDITKTKDGGIHFGEIDQAQMRSLGKDSSQIGVYLDIRNPKRMRDTGGDWKAKILAAKQQGYDGIVYLNRYEGMTTDTVVRAQKEGINLDTLTDAQFRKFAPEAKDSYIAFNEKQIKPATPSATIAGQGVEAAGVKEGAGIIGGKLNPSLVSQWHSADPSKGTGLGRLGSVGDIIIDPKVAEQFKAIKDVEIYVADIKPRGAWGEFHTNVGGKPVIYIDPRATEKSLWEEIIHADRAAKGRLMREVAEPSAKVGREYFAGAIPPAKPPVAPPTITGGIPANPTPEESVANLVLAVKDIDAKTLRRQTEIIRSMERKQRAGMVAGALEGGKGEQAFITAKGQLKGRLSFPEIVAPEKQLQPQDVFNLNEMIRQSEQRPFTKLSTQDALMKLLGGELPTRNEMALLEEVFGVDLAKELLKKRALGPKVYETFLDAIGLFKAMKASADISAPARQGALLFGEPSWWKSWKPMLKAFASEEDAVASMQQITKNTLYPLAEKADLYIAPWGKQAIQLTTREESFMSRLTQKIPWVKWSERAYVTYLNELRAGTFYKYAKQWQDLPIPKTELDEKLGRLADFINRATGRGNLGVLGKGELPVIGNAIFFSPKFVASRFQAPFHLVSSDPDVRKVVAKNLSAFVGAGLGIMTMAKLAGAEVEVDPRSSDFGKIRVGNTRWDVWAGFAQIARYTAQFLTATRKTVDIGRTYPTPRAEVAQRFLESKLSPAVGLLLSALKGQNFIGEPMELSTETARREAWNALIPMFIADMVDAIREEGLIGIPMALPAAIGMGVTTYPARGKPEWAADIQSYLDIPTSVLEVKERGIPSRDQYRKDNPVIDAKLFIMGQVSSIQSEEADSIVRKILEVEKIDPMTINVVKKWSPEVNARRLKQGLKDTLTDSLIKDLRKGK